MNHMSRMTIFERRGYLLDYWQELRRAERTALSRVPSSSAAADPERLQLPALEPVVGRPAGPAIMRVQAEGDARARTTT